MAEHAREGFIRRASGEKALFTQELFRRQCTALTRDLTGPDPTPLETLLVDRIVLCWLHLHYAENIYVQAMLTSRSPRPPFTNGACRWRRAATYSVFHMT